jgi:hypothetical protein
VVVGHASAGSVNANSNTDPFVQCAEIGNVSSLNAEAGGQHAYDASPRWA